MVIFLYNTDLSSGYRQNTQNWPLPPLGMIVI